MPFACMRTYRKLKATLSTREERRKFIRISTFPLRGNRCAFVQLVRSSSLFYLFSHLLAHSFRLFISTSYCLRSLAERHSSFIHFSSLPCLPDTVFFSINVFYYVEWRSSNARFFFYIGRSLLCRSLVSGAHGRDHAAYDPTKARQLVNDIIQLRDCKIRNGLRAIEHNVSHIKVT